MRTVKEEIRVRWSETDTAGIAHFTSFFVYFEAAEQKLFREILKINPRNRTGPNSIVGLPRVEAYCQYFSPARFDDSPRSRIEDCLSWKNEHYLRVFSSEQDLR